MTGPEHYRRAEALLDSAQVKASEDIDDAGRVVEFYPVDQEDDGVANVIAAAQVHATLAVAAATVEPGAMWQGIRPQPTPVQVDVEAAIRAGEDEGE